MCTQAFLTTILEGNVICDLETTEPPSMDLQTSLCFPFLQLSKQEKNKHCGALMHRSKDSMRSVLFNL